jgi:hypothetical protein
MRPECYFVQCREPPAIEAIGSYDGVFGIKETVAVVFCERHAKDLADEVLVLMTA